MKHAIQCPECFKINDREIVYAYGELNSDFIAVCKCPKNHLLISSPQVDLFDYLYYSAVFSFQQSCYTESVMSFTASLERAYELFIKAVMFKEGSDFTKIEKFWKEIISQSERQYGAFCLQYFRVADDVWKANQDQVRFRNKVVYRGYIATSNEVEKYAEYITDCLMKILKILHSNFRNECYIIADENRKKINEKIDKLKVEHETGIIPVPVNQSLLNWNITDFVETTFSDARKKIDLKNNLGKHW